MDFITQRRQIVSESDVLPGDGFVRRQINVATLRQSEREYRMLYRLLSIGTATVLAFFMGFEDARFGISDGDSIEQWDYLPPGQSVITPLITFIRNDFIIEEEECFSIQISPRDTPGFRELFTCNDDSTNSTNYFCQHTICIEDDDGKN